MKEQQAQGQPWKKERLRVALELQSRKRQEVLMGRIPALNQEASKVLGEQGVLVTPKELTLRSCGQLRQGRAAA
ncbi:MAG: hypothetical protein K8R57_02840 [Verrucomicrobia bacterium]|nr:hypothetical protein [Verrucomicrobiota bacterium]